ncbi:MAG: sensor histidine kinase [Firmicutes bacterium]|nr:sensor histidine kinase [Bacillota bacterium]MBQ9960304.1 sensor histidine kinase [Bacillota bacterium]
MIDTILYFIYYTGVLAFGILLTFAFSDIQFSKKNVLISAAIFAGCGLALLLAYILMQESEVWKIYPVIVHIPLALVLYFYYRKPLVTVFASVCTAYMCCQLPKWVGILCEALTGSYAVSKLLRTITLFIVGYILIRWFAHYISEIFSKEPKNVLIFSSVPMVYYIFDYSMGVYTQLMPAENLVAIEFMPFFLCIVFFVFCTIYYKEVEQKAIAVQKENIIRIALEQQKKEVDAVKRSEKEIRIMRHDMRHFLDILSLSLSENDIESSKRIIENLKTTTDSTILQHYCNSEMINYIISSYVSKCEELDVELETTVELDDLELDEILFSSILSNALDNALNAVKNLDEERRFIKFMLKSSGDKILLSVKNPYEHEPRIIGGMPVSDRAGHGYGTQSIRFLTEKAGGNCQFSIQDHLFTLRVVI